MISIIIEIIGKIIYFIPELIVLGAVVYYLVNNESIDGLLMTIGSAISILIMIFYSLLPLLFEYNFFDYNQIGGLILKFISFVGHICFAIGLFMLIKKNVKKKSH